MPQCHATVAFAAAVTLAFAAGTARAQSELRAGTRVKITAPGVIAGDLDGVVLARTADSLTVGSPSVAPLTLAMSRITRLEISRGNSRSEGAKRGLLWSVPVSAAIVALSSATPRCTSCRSTPSRGEEVAGYIIGTSLWGASLGALIGRERWEPFDIATHATSALVVHDGHPALGARLAF